LITGGRLQRLTLTAATRNGVAATGTGVAATGISEKLIYEPKNVPKSAE